MRRAADLVGIPAAMAAMGDLPGGLVAGVGTALAEPAAIRIQRQIQDPEVRRMVAPYVVSREAERRGQQTRI